jgi:uncharacterized protein (DUF433 family)
LHRIDHEGAVQLEDYFDFPSPDDVRLRGSRIGIESVLYEYVHRCKTAEEIAQQFETLTLEQVYATILYYLHNRDAVNRYLADWIEWGRQMRGQQAAPSADFQERMRRARESLAATGRRTS